MLDRCNAILHVMSGIYTLFSSLSRWIISSSASVSCPPSSSAIPPAPGPGPTPTSTYVGTAAAAGMTLTVERITPDTTKTAMIAIARRVASHFALSISVRKSDREMVNLLLISCRQSHLRHHPPGLQSRSVSAQLSYRSFSSPSPYPHYYQLVAFQIELPAYSLMPH